MAASKLSALLAPPGVTGTDFMYVVAAGASKKLTLTNLAAAVITLGSLLTTGVADAAYQPLNANLTSFAAISPASLLTTAAAAAGYQPLNANLTSYAAIAPASFGLIASVNTWTAQNTFADGTITTSKPHTLTQTWNAGGVTFNALLVNVTATASAAASTLVDLQVAGASKFKVTRDGSTTLGAAALYINGNGGLTQFWAGAAVGWSATNDPTAAMDVTLFRDAANTLAQRNGVNAQTLRVYNTFTDASNYERGVYAWSGNSLFLGTAKAGTGSTRDLQFLIGGATVWQMSTNGHLITGTDNTYDIGASGATRPRNVYIGTQLSVGATALMTGSLISTSATGSMGWVGRAGMYSPADGVIRLTDNADTPSFNRLQFGGTTSSFPALKRSTTILQAVLADDTGFAPLQGKLRTDVNATTGLTAGVLAATTNATIVITDASGQAYRVPCII